MKNLELPIWDLTDFYPSSDSKEFKDDISLLDSEVVNFCIPPLKSCLQMLVCQQLLQGDALGDNNHVRACMDLGL